jgi:hypothetical protein
VEGHDLVGAHAGAGESSRHGPERQLANIRQDARGRRARRRIGGAKRVVDQRQAEAGRRRRIDDLRFRLFRISRLGRIHFVRPSSDLSLS